MDDNYAIENDLNCIKKENIAKIKSEVPTGGNIKKVIIF
jgi:hypothetical protein